MNYSIDIHYTTSDCPARQEQSIHQLPQQKSKVTRKQRNSKKIKAKKCNFVWTIKEQRSYISFLKLERELFRLSPKERKIVKINLQMSSKVKTRTAPQCHSHHQKMMKKHGTIEAIISASTPLFSREKREVLKEDEEEASKELQIPENSHIQKESVEVRQQGEDSKRPIWWQYLDLMDVSPDEIEFHAYSYDSNASL